jgi:hypothetical protein
MAAILNDGDEPKNMEPDKCESIAWLDDWDNMPQPLMMEYNKHVQKQLLDEYLDQFL